jgi:RNA polymerase sigma factor (sigma-70 family)
MSLVVQIGLQFVKPYEGPCAPQWGTWANTRLGQNVKFEDFYRKNRDVCFRAVFVTVHNVHEADDLTSEAFTRAFSGCNEVSRHASPNAWVVRTALNLHRDRWRRENNPKRHLLALRDLHEDKSDSVDPALMLALSQLSDQQRSVLVYRVLLDLSTEMVAEHLGLSVSTVSTHLNRALIALRANLQPEDYVFEGNVNER